MEPPAPPHSSRLIVDCDAIAANFHRLSRRVTPAECGAVVKADAYGLGIDAIATALLDAGCRLFFVARLCEAQRLRPIVGSGSEITILNGLDPGSEAACAEAGFVPVLNSATQLAAWRGTPGLPRGDYRPRCKSTPACLVSACRPTRRWQLQEILHWRVSSSSSF